jgi:ParB/RepB/Spo0J family partition protein
MATDHTTRHTVALDAIDVPANVRDIDWSHVDGLADSIKLLGVLVPIVVRRQGERYQLVAGFHRVEAARKAALQEIPADVRDADSEQTDRAVENIARKQLRPDEEAQAVQAMLDKGLTHEGAAQALGWPKARVAARVKLLELSDRGRELVGAGVIPLSAVDNLLAIGAASTELVDGLIAYVDDEDTAHLGEHLASDPAWLLGAALRDGAVKAFAAYLGNLGPRDVEDLRLGKKTTALYSEAEKLYRDVEQYAYGPPPMRFGDAEVDQARAAGVLIEFDHGTPVIVDPNVYRELAKQLIERTVDELREKAAQRKKRQKAQAKLAAPADPAAEAKRDRDRKLRGLADRAHGVNLELGAALINGLSVVDPTDMTVARFFSYALLGADFERGSYMGTVGEQVRRLAAHGVRLVVDELREDVTKTRKDGSRGRLRIDYGDERDPQAAVKWLWKFVDGAKSAGELYGRTLVVIAADHYALQLVVPTSQRGHPVTWSSHRHLANKTLRKLAGPHLPASLTQLERAIKRAHSAYDKALGGQRSTAETNRSAPIDAAGGEEPEDVDDAT